jgi:type I restriction enzyme, S subunit
LNVQASAKITPAIRTWKAYPAYKDSGVEWLGRVPAHWESKKIKRLCLVKRGASPRPIEDPIYFDDDGEYSWVRISDVTASTKYLERTEQRLSEHGKSKSVSLEPGELFLSIAATVGKPIITKIKCCIHDGFVYFVGLKQNREYLFYLFSSGELYKGIGKTGTQLNLNTDTIGDIRIPLPSSSEQNVVVAFLDRETAKINALVAKKERLIALLLEKRAALITRAVTKGLPSISSGQATLDVPMKDSGVEWLGEIPAHWEVKRIKHLAKVLRGKFSHRPRNDPMLYDGRTHSSRQVILRRRINMSESISKRLMNPVMRLAKNFQKEPLSWQLRRI